MNTNEFAVWGAALKTYYPKENILPNPQAVDLWYMQLKDIPFDVAQAALKKWASLNRWSPSIADIREMASEALLKEKSPQEWSEAWQDLKKAVGKYGSYQEKEALESLTPLTRKVTEQIGYRIICMCEEEDLRWYSEQFRKIYTTYAQKAKEELLIPEQVKGMLKAIEGRRQA